MTKTMTAADAACLAAIKRCLDRHPYSPTVREIAQEAGLLSTATAHRHIHRLVAAGVVTQVPRIARSIMVVDGA